MNAMGNSFPCSSFYVIIAAREGLDVKVYNKKSFVKSGICKEGVAALEVLMFSRASFSIDVNLN